MTLSRTTAIRLNVSRVEERSLAEPAVVMASAGPAAPTCSAGLPALIAASMLLAAAVSPAQPEMAFQPRGPGTVFPTIESAAADALAYAHQREDSSSTSGRSHGGVIVELGGGYTYGPLLTERPAAPNAPGLRLDRNTVAHFHTHPRQGDRIDQSSHTLPRAARWLAIRADAKKQPHYALTPSLQVVVYHGRGETRTADVFVADLSLTPEARSLATNQKPAEAADDVATLNPARFPPAEDRRSVYRWDRSAHQA